LKNEGPGGEGIFFWKRLLLRMGKTDMMVVLYTGENSIRGTRVNAPQKQQ